MRPEQLTDVQKWWDEAARRFPEEPSTQAVWHFLNQMENEQAALKYFDSMPERLFTKDGAYKYFDANKSFTRQQLQDAAKEFYSDGHLYKLDIPDEDVAKYLDWDKPLSEQGDLLKNLGESVSKRLKGNFTDAPTGFSLYEALRPIKGGDKEASEYLQSLGIPGIRYLDGNSRNAGEGSYNYVTFDPSRINVLERNGRGLP